ncbi:UDP-4-amino-4,6-dideoxy-N-acetyl-beta-L-altrosamine N-acetyltransferase [Rheinheimera marina]|uniref:UDP-4-amino-4, 6-dideoxy-N-acetyl-beta-L-altrosamine N-acetyltransferase n=1 Tax=Rheinheimera marina TaxID=1774958 RepID=A0ABV9JRP9_9GAMM
MTQTRFYPLSRFSPLTAQESELVLSWRNQPHIRRMMHQDAEISFEQHQAWFADIKGRSDRAFFVFYQNDKAIGVLNFSKKTDHSLEWGCYLGETQVWPGSGLLLEIAALDYAASQADIQTLYAEVLSLNKNVLKLHQLFEYDEDSCRQGGFRDQEVYQVHCFSYPVQKWQQERQRILHKLPPAIREAAALITFTD